MGVIPYGRQSIDDRDVQAVVEVLRSDFITQGPMAPRFETAVAEYCKAAHAIAVNSATSALHLACLALGVGPGDRVWTSPNSFVASANCARYCGASVDFVDIDPATYNMSVTALAAKLEEAAQTRTLPKVVIPVHFTGLPCDMAAIRELSDRYDFRLIEDASHAIGASYTDSTIGDSRYSDITVFSFHPVKILTTGEGGMLLTNSAALHSRLARLRTHGITREPDEMLHRQDGPWYYEQLELGYNYRLTDIQAALGLAQFARLQEFLARRRDLAARYQSLLRELPIQLPANPRDRRSSNHLYVIRLRGSQPARHRQVFEALRRNGIGVNVHYIPIHLQPYYRALGFKEGDFPEAESYYREAMSLPLYFSLSDQDQDRVVSELRRALA
jgi:UDP-4-amino-4,6-dideoxy-N-acetyl-beta-L-altrosamine transaminase